MEPYIQGTIAMAALYIGVYAVVRIIEKSDK
jgi:hypothetical protein